MHMAYSPTIHNLTNCTLFDPSPFSGLPTLLLFVGELLPLTILSVVLVHHPSIHHIPFRHTLLYHQSPLSITHRPHTSHKMSASAMDHRKNNFKGKANFSAQEVSINQTTPRDQLALWPPIPTSSFIAFITSMYVSNG